MCISVLAASGYVCVSCTVQTGSGCAPFAKLDVSGAEGGPLKVPGLLSNRTGAEAAACSPQTFVSCDCWSTFLHFFKALGGISDEPVCVCVFCTVTFLSCGGSPVTQGPRQGPAVRASIQPFAAQTVGKWRPRFRPTRLANISQQTPSLSSCFLEPQSKYNPARMVDFPPTCPENDGSEILR